MFRGGRGGETEGVIRVGKVTRLGEALPDEAREG